MVAAIICTFCRPGILGGEPMHHPGLPQGHTTPGVLGGWYCACPCVGQSEPAVSSEPTSATDVPVGPEYSTESDA